MRSHHDLRRTRRARGHWCGCRCGGGGARHDGSCTRHLPLGQGTVLQAPAAPLMAGWGRPTVPARAATAVRWACCWVASRRRCAGCRLPAPGRTLWSPRVRRTPRRRATPDWSGDEWACCGRRAAGSTGLPLEPALSGVVETDPGRRWSCPSGVDTPGARLAPITSVLHELPPAPHRALRAATHPRCPVGRPDRPGRRRGAVAHYPSPSLRPHRHTRRSPNGSVSWTDRSAAEPCG